MNAVKSRRDFDLHAQWEARHTRRHTARGIGTAGALSVGAVESLGVPATELAGHRP
jgi:hypothetical protein